MKIKSLQLVLAGIAVMLLICGYRWSRDDQDAVPSYAVPTQRSALSHTSLQEAVGRFFNDNLTPSIGETRALLILRDGKIVAERYATGFGPKSRMLSWSVAKSVTGLLVGIMVGDGRLALDEPAPVAAWQQPGDPRSRITLRHIMQMRSGLAHIEQGEEREKADTLRMLVGSGAPDQAGYAAAKPLRHQPGSFFNYSTASSTLLAGIVTDRLTGSRHPEARRQAMARFMAARLSAPLGLSSLVAEYDASGTMLGGAMMHMTARDYAKIGELLRNRGRADGRQIVPETWVDFMINPSPANPAYGGQVWLNRAGQQSDLFPGLASSRIYGAVGYRGQFVIVSPEQRLTVVRLGVTNERDLTALRHELARLIQALPQ
jgi:CubicO group peptidase (beta-lactamase class C family)